MWLITPKGISIFDGHSWKSLKVQDTLTGNYVNDMATDADGSIWIATNNGVTHYSGDSTGVGYLHSLIPTAQHFQLLQNSPNPFNASTTIRYNLVESSVVKLAIYNMAGQLIINLVDAVLPPGEYSAKWNAEQVPTGIYICQLQVENLQQARKVILQK